MRVQQAQHFSDSPRRREYFDVLYQGLCGAHIAAAVLAKGGIVANDKRTWLRKVCPVSYHVSSMAVLKAGQ